MLQECVFVYSFYDTFYAFGFSYSMYLLKGIVRSLVLTVGVVVNKTHFLLLIKIHFSLCMYLLIRTFFSKRKAGIFHKPVLIFLSSKVILMFSVFELLASMLFLIVTQILICFLRIPMVLSISNY